MARILQLRGDVLTLTRTVGEDLHPETKAWRASAAGAGGTFLPDSVSIADAFIRALHASSYNSKIVWLMPLLGGNLYTAMTPLRDRLGVGRPATADLAEGDFSQARGLQGNGTTKYLDSRIKPSQLGVSNNGGLGWWELSIVFGGNVEPIGAYSSTGSGRFVIDLRNSLQSFWWGTNASVAGLSAGASSAHYYGQRVSSTLREFYRDGDVRDVDTVTDSASGASDRTIHVLGSNELSPAPWPGRGGCAYLTDGTMSGAEAAAFHALLRDSLMVPTGRL